MMMNDHNSGNLNSNSAWFSVPNGVMGSGGNDNLNGSSNSTSSNHINNVNNLSSNNSVSAFLRNIPGGNSAAMQGMMAGIGGSSGSFMMGGGAPNHAMSNMGNMMATAMNNNNNGSAQNPMMNMNHFNFEQLKRLQQMAQLQQQASLISQHSAQHDPSAALLQTYLDQKIQTSRFADLGAMGAVGGFQGIQGQNPILGMAGGANLFAMNQGNIANNNANAMGGLNNGSTNDMQLPSPNSLFHRDLSRRMRGGVIEPFPEKLHRLLLEVEAANRGDVISFVANGRAFAIHKPEKFFEEIVPLYFRQSRLSSFKRQLNLYGFELINTGPARGGYYHELFVKDRPELCRRMRRVAVKVTPKAVTSDPLDEDAIKSCDLDKPNASKALKEENEDEADSTAEDVSEVAPPSEIVA